MHVSAIGPACPHARALTNCEQLCIRAQWHIPGLAEAGGVTGTVGPGVGGPDVRGAKNNAFDGAILYLTRKIAGVNLNFRILAINFYEA